MAVFGSGYMCGPRVLVDPPYGSVNQSSPMNVSPLSPSVGWSIVLGTRLLFLTASRQWQLQWQLTPLGFNLVGPYLVG